MCVRLGPYNSNKYSYEHLGEIEWKLGYEFLLICTYYFNSNHGADGDIYKYTENTAKRHILLCQQQK